ncbi:MAG: C1 family peptidase [candidate division Zixibacteria bacterium]|nr:C1 family peptidase [candidate division Zixibacteria bacterium]
MNNPQIFDRLSSRMALLLTVFLLFLTAAPVFGQLTADDLDSLREQAKEEGWTFKITDNPATKYSLDELCGFVEPPDWQKNARFDPCTPRKDLPSAFDWRELDGCTSVKNQGGCGSCWAFSTVGPLECNIKIQDGIEVDLSEQYLVSCNHHGWGCDGGWYAHDYHQDTEDPCDSSGAVLEEDFEYDAWDLPCGCPYTHPYHILDWYHIGQPYEMATVEAMKQAIIDYGPISVAVAANSAMQSYGGGIFTGCDYGATINHAVVLVGWDDSQGSAGIWIMRNSWGTWWGEGGYMRMPYGCSHIGYNACYIRYAGGVYFESDIKSGWVPFDVNYNAESGLEVDTWSWEFGDGEQGNGKTTTHTYSQAGTFDVTCEINAGEDIRSRTHENFIMALADTISPVDAVGAKNKTFAVPIYAHNNVPVRYMLIPVEYQGDLDLHLDSLSTVGCRTDYFEVVESVASDPWGKTAAFKLITSNDNSVSPLPPGEGIIANLYFTIGDEEVYGDTTAIFVDGFSSQELLFSWPLLSWEPVASAGTVSMTTPPGDVNGVPGINVSDVTFLVSYLFLEGPAPDPLESADVNCDYNNNVSDITYLVQYLFAGGPEPHSCM